MWIFSSGLSGWTYCDLGSLRKQQMRPMKHKTFQILHKDRIFLIFCKGLFFAWGHAKIWVWGDVWTQIWSIFMPYIFLYDLCDSLIPLILFKFDLNSDANRYLKDQNLSLTVLLFLIKFWEFLMQNLTHNIILWILVLMLMFQQ